MFIYRVDQYGFWTAQSRFFERKKERQSLFALQDTNIIT